MKFSKFKLTYISLVLVMCFLSVNFTVYASNNGLTWPNQQYLPSFAAPSDNLDLIDISNATYGEQNLFVTLQGLINRSTPRIYVHQPRESRQDEGKYTWLNDLQLSYTEISNPYDLITKYRNEIKGVIVYDTNQPDTINLATSIASLQDAIICSANEVQTLTSAPYNLSIVMDLRGQFSSKLAVYQYLYDNYWSQLTHRAIFNFNCGPTVHNGIEHGFNRDYAYAMKTACIWLEPNDSAEDTLLRKFFEDMPVNSPILGWWAAEGPMVLRGSQYGLPVACTDWGTNFSVFAGMSRELQNVPTLGEAPELENKLYVAIIISDGDNIMYSQHRHRIIWEDVNRGKMPLTWTISPGGFKDVMPAIANYYYATRTANDFFMAGPSGLGYTYPINWDTSELREFSKLTETYMQYTGLNSITGWQTNTNTDTIMSKETPSLLGITRQYYGSGKFLVDNGQTIVSDIRLPYTSHAHEMNSTLSYTLNEWNGQSPSFLMMQGFGFADDINPTSIYNALNSYLSDSRVKFVSVDEYFQLLKKSLNGVTPPPPNNDNLALNKNVTASSQRVVDVASRGNDGNIGTWWGSIDNAYPATYTVDFGEEQSINRVVLKLDGSWPSRTQNMEIKGSVDGVSFNTIVASKDYLFSSGDAEVVIDFNTLDVKYLRIIIHSNSEDNKAQIGEIEVY